MFLSYNHFAYIICKERKFMLCERDKYHSKNATLRISLNLYIFCNSFRSKWCMHRKSPVANKSFQSTRFAHILKPSSVSSSLCIICITNLSKGFYDLNEITINYMVIKKRQGSSHPCEIICFSFLLLKFAFNDSQ